MREYNRAENDEFYDKKSLNNVSPSGLDGAGKSENVGTLCKDDQDEYNNNVSGKSSCSSHALAELKHSSGKVEELDKSESESVYRGKQDCIESEVQAFHNEGFVKELGSSLESDFSNSSEQTADEDSWKSNTFITSYYSKMKNTKYDYFHSPRFETPKNYKEKIELNPERKELPKANLKIAIGHLCVKDEGESQVSTRAGEYNISSNSSSLSLRKVNESHDCFENRKRNIDLSLEWIKNELEQMDLFDLQLVRQFSRILNDITFLKDNVKEHEEYLIDLKNIDNESEKPPLFLDEVKSMVRNSDSFSVQEVSTYASKVEAVCNEVSTFYVPSAALSSGKLKCFVMDTI